ncbi:50S ribosomal protein [Dirofilaria immitis]
MTGCRSEQGSNLRGQSPLDFKSNSLTTRTSLPLDHYSPRTQRAGFEPARAKPIGFQVQLLNRSDIAAPEAVVPDFNSKMCNKPDIVGQWTSYYANDILFESKQEFEKSAKTGFSLSKTRELHHSSISSIAERIEPLPSTS